MRYSAFWVLFSLCFAPAALPREEQVLCGTRPGRWQEESFLHRQAERVRKLKRMGAAAAAEAPRADRDAGNIAILEDSGGVVSRRNDFNLARRTLTFQPAAGATRYTFALTGGAYDPAAASAGTPVANLGDDDFRSVRLPFAFPYFGATYNEIFVNSDGNLTFTAGDGASLARSLGRFSAGPPRIAPLFEDLDPSVAADGIRVLAEPNRFVVSWAEVPEFQDIGVGPLQTFQVRLYPDGRIEFAWGSIASSGAVVGITPGELRGKTSLVSFANEPSAEYPATVAERFGGTLELDITTAAQRFYETHEDAYDYLVFFNDQDIRAEASAVAYESTVRNSRGGYGDEQLDVGKEFGSPARLQAVMNMGPLSQYPPSPDARVPARGTVGDTPVTVIAHEAGHLFLAYASVRDAADPLARPMLGFQSAHWFFGFNSDASLLEGNRIQDRGRKRLAALPHHRHGGRVFSARSVPDGPARTPRGGARAPDVLRHRDARFIRAPPASDRGDRGRLRAPRRAPGRDRGGDGTPHARLHRCATALPLRVHPDNESRGLAHAGGPRQGGGLPRGLRGLLPSRDFRPRHRRYIAQAQPAALAFSCCGPAGRADDRGDRRQWIHRRQRRSRVALERKTGVTEMPADVTIPAGAKSAVFTIRGSRAGVEDLLAIPNDTAYHNAAVRVQVSAIEDVRVAAVSGDRPAPNATSVDPVVVRLTDANNLPYPGVRLQAAASDGSAVAQAVVVTGEDGRASFRWTPGTAPVNELRIGIEGAAPALTVRAGARAVSALAVVNAASFAARVSPGALATIFGNNLAGGAQEQARTPWPRALAGVTVLVNGRPAPLVFVSDGQINFLVPADLVDGVADVAVTNAAGASAPLRIAVAPLAPGLFGALVSGTGRTTAERAARRGEYLEVYATGLGPVRTGEDGLARTTLAVQATVAGIPTAVIFSGMTGYEGLYQVNVRVPDGAGSGAQPLVLTVGGVRSSELKIAVE